MQSGVSSSSRSCSANALEWFAFTASLAFLLIPWWLTAVFSTFAQSGSRHREDHVALQDYPLDEEPLTAPPPYSLEPQHPSPPHTSQTGRGRRFLNAVQWNCLRCIQPGYLAIYSMVRSHDHRSWPALYYFGHNLQHPPEIGLWHWAMIIGTDILPLGLQALLIYLGTTDFDKDGKMLPGWWVIGLMPPTVTGLYVVGLSFLPRVPSLKTTVFCGVAFHAILATAIIVPVAHTPRSLGTYKEPSSFGAIIAFQWFLMVSPMAMYKCPGPSVHLFFVVLGTVLRGVPLATALGGNSKDFPFCFDNFVALPIIFGLIQCGGVFTLACFSSLRCERNRASIRRRKHFQGLEQESSTAPLTLPTGANSEIRGQESSSRLSEVSGANTSTKLTTSTYNDGTG